MSAKHQKIPLIYVLLLLLTSAAGLAHSSRRFNVFEPIFADDDSDTHTVSAGARTAPEFGRRLNSSSGLGEQVSSVLPPKVEDIARQRPSATPAALARPTTPLTLIKKHVQSTSEGEQKKNSNAKRQINGTTVPYSSDTLATVSARKQQTSEQPKHWSALENYYEKLRQSVLAKQLYDKPLGIDESAAFNQLVQESVSDHSMANSQKYLPIYRGDSGSLSGGKQAGRPSILSSIPHSSAQPFSFPSRPDNYRPEPYVSADPNSGIGAASLLMVPLMYSQQQQQQQRQEPIIVLPQMTKGGLDAFSAPGSKQLVIQQQPVQIDARQPVVQQQQQQAQIQKTSSAAWPQTAYNLDGFGAGYELRKLPELLFIQQAQNRAKHQQETFGSWYDDQRVREQLRDEAHCGPRNQLYPVDAPPTDFPSHAGLYNGSQMADDDFICAAIWVHERFALTLASCIKNASSTSLHVRLGEWNLNRNWTHVSAASGLSNQQLQKATMSVRQVSRVHLFPSYTANSSEHNLALLEWTQPVDFLEAPSGSPACQMQPRSALKANNCWAPLRNITFTEYFDAEGEGETKLRRAVKMDQAPIRLLASDDTECLKQTAIEFFNFQHPNYICSANIQKAVWRLKLNHPDFFGSGIYCNEAGSLNLVSILHPLLLNSSSAFGYMDLSYYRPWMRNVMSGRSS